MMTVTAGPATVSVSLATRRTRNQATTISARSVATVEGTGCEQPEKGWASNSEVQASRAKLNGLSSTKKVHNGPFRPTFRPPH